MRVCTTHRCWNHPDDKITETCPLAEWEQVGSGATAGCEWVPMRLIPDNAETVERIAETICRIDNQTGPEVAVEGIPCDIHRSVATSVLATLDAETP